MLKDIENTKQIILEEIKKLHSRLYSYETKQKIFYSNLSASIYALKTISIDDKNQLSEALRTEFKERLVSSKSCKAIISQYFAKLPAEANATKTIILNQIDGVFPEHDYNRTIESIYTILTQTISNLDTLSQNYKDRLINKLVFVLKQEPTSLKDCHIAISNDIDAFVQEVQAAVKAIKADASKIYDNMRLLGAPFPEDLEEAMDAYTSEPAKKLKFAETLNRYRVLASDDKQAITQCFNTTLDKNPSSTRPSCHLFFQPEAFSQAFNTALDAHFADVIKVQTAKNTSAISFNGLSIPSPTQSPFSPKSTADLVDTTLPTFTNFNFN